LKRADRHIDVVPVLFLRFEEEEHQIGARGEVESIVADNERNEVARCLEKAGLQHLNRVVAHDVHLRVELDAKDAVSEIHEAGARVPFHDGGSFLRRTKNLEIGRGRRNIAPAYHVPTTL